MAHHTPVTADFQTPEAAGNSYGNANVSGPAKVIFGNVYLGSGSQGDIALDPVQATQAFLRTLYFPEIQNRYYSIDPELRGTCQWFLNHDLYKQCVIGDATPDQCRFLWLKGKPGSGKSTIMKAALEHANVLTKTSISEKSPSEQSSCHLRVVIHFFFNARGAPLEHNVEGFLRSTLTQLYQGRALSLDSQPLAHFLRKPDQTATTWKWTEGELRFMFRDAVRQSRCGLSMFIDALDECDEEQVRSFVDFLVAELGFAQDCSTPVSLCISSRHYPNITTPNCHTLIAEDYNRNDIQTFVDTLMISNHSDVGDLVKKVAWGADGVFLWTKIVVRRLKKALDEGESRANVLSIIDTIPSDLEQIYAALLSSVCDSEREEARMIFSYLLYLKRPLSLQNFIVAFAFRTRYQSPYEFLSSDADIPENQMKNRLTRRTRGLVEVKTTSYDGSIVQFAHGSIREYLLQNLNQICTTAAPPHRIEAIAHSEIARSCINFIAMNFYREWRTLAGPRYSDIYQFRDYAKCHALQHAKKAEENGIQQDYIGTVFRFDQCPSQWYAFPFIPQIRRRSGSSYPRSSALSDCCEHRLLSVVSTLRPIERGFVAASALTRPLCIAVSIEYEEMVALLIGKGAMVNATDEFYETALHTSIAKGNVAISKLLLQKGADPNAPGEWGSPLTLASSRGDLAHVRLLVENGADVDTVSNAQGYALLAAVSEGHVDTVQYLLRHTARMSVRCYYKGGRYARKKTSVLAEASFWGHDRVVEVLLAAPTVTDLSLLHFKEAIYAARAGGSLSLIVQLEEAARSLFGLLWQTVDTSKIDTLPCRPSRHYLVLDVRGLAGVAYQLPIRANHQARDIKHAIEKREGMSSLHQCLLLVRAHSRGGVRVLHDEQYLCNWNIVSGERIEVVLHTCVCRCAPTGRRHGRMIHTATKSTGDTLG